MIDDARMTALLDREAIRDCIYRYCRGIDRADEVALRSSYWPDATDQHGAYSGPVEGFFEWVGSVLKTNPRNVHLVGNILIEFLDAAHAAVETYFLVLQRAAAADGAVRQCLMTGRYCDLFEKREGEWRVARRVVTYDWLEDQPVQTEPEPARFGARTPIGSNYPNDPIYAVLAGSRHICKRVTAAPPAAE
jgi:hypothetical protein